MKVCIIGAGISGLSIAKMLTKEGFEVNVYEKQLQCGGIARTKNVSGNAYHLVGGHCFNSKHQEVLDFVFDEIMPKNEWNQIVRKADIHFKGNYIDYPIEYSMKQISSFNEELAYSFITDFLDTKDVPVSSNLKDWFINNFGKSLANEYFIPYNEKIWGMKVDKMSPAWVTTKLPLPNKKNFIKGLLNNASDNMPHSKFYYPKTNNQNTFIEKLAEGIDITYDFEIYSLIKKNNIWIVNKQFEYDVVINTAPLDTICNIVDDFPDEINKNCKKLKYNQVTTMLWSRRHVDSTWTYFPDKTTPFHRHIHIGNFFVPSENISITEAVGFLSYDEMVSEGMKVDYLIKPLAYNVSERAYVIFDENYDDCRSSILNYLDSIDLYTLGRFGEWEYYNMDVCIKSALELKKQLTGKK